MRPWKWAFPTIMLVTLGLAAAAPAQVDPRAPLDCIASLEDAFGPSGQTYQPGETIEYVLTLSVPPGPDYCTLTDLEVYFFPPPGVGDACGDLGAGLHIATISWLAPGDPPMVFDSSNAPVMAYVVQESDVGTEIKANSAVRYHSESDPGIDMCDGKLVVNHAVCPDPCLRAEVSLDCDEAVVGQDIVFEICATNCGEADLTILAVNCTLLGDVTGFFPGDLPPYSQVCQQFTYTVQPGDDPGPGTTLDVAVVIEAISDCDGTPVNNFSDPAEITLLHPDLNVDVFCTGLVAPGDDAVFDVTFLNTGDVELDVSAPPVGFLTLSPGGVYVGTLTETPTPGDPEVCAVLHADVSLPPTYCNPYSFWEEDVDCCPVVLEPLVCEVEPDAAQICEGGALTFHGIVEGGTPPYTYIWWSDACAGPVVCTGQTTDTFVIGNVTPTGSYTVTLAVVDAGGDQTTCAAAFDVIPEISCSLDPHDPVCEGGTIAFHPTIIGATAGTIYCWEYSPDGVGYGGCLANTKDWVVTTAASVADEGWYRLTVTGECGVCEAVTFVRVDQRPTCSISPMAPVCYGEPIVITPVVIEDPDLTTMYCWQYSADHITYGSCLATTRDFHVTAGADFGDQGWYRLTASNSCGAGQAEVFVEIDPCVDDCIHIWLPADTLTSPGEVISVPVTAQDLTGWGVMAFEMNVCWCRTPSGLLNFMDCSPGPVLSGSGWGDPYCNECPDNCVSIAAAGTDPLEGEGVLFYLNFYVSSNAKPCMCCTLDVTGTVYDPENPLEICWHSGKVCIEWCDIVGCVDYWKCCEDECGDTLRPFGLEGVEAHLDLCDTPIGTELTGPEGCYAFTCLDPLESDDCLYCVSLDYCGVPCPRPVTGFDASLVLQYLVCLDPLDDCVFDSFVGRIYPQRKAADASCNGIITSYDASLILQYAVGDLPAFPCADPWLWYPLGDPCVYACDRPLDWVGVYIGDVGGCPDCPPPPGLLLAGGEAVVVSLGVPEDLGDRYEVSVEVDGAYDIFSGDMGLTFDAGELYVISMVPSGLASGSMSAYNEVGGTLEFAMASGASYGGDGTIATLTLGKMHTGAEISSLRLEEVLFNDGNPPVELGTGAGIGGVSLETSLGSAVPNPFRDGTRIFYSLGAATDVTISIYSVTGQLVATVEDGWVESGEHSAWWSGVDVSGAPVSRGVYFCKMRTAGYSGTTKIVLVD